MPTALTAGAWNTFNTTYGSSGLYISPQPLASRTWFFVGVWVKLDVAGTQRHEALLTMPAMTAWQGNGVFAGWSLVGTEAVVSIGTNYIAFVASVLTDTSTSAAGGLQPPHCCTLQT